MPIGVFDSGLGGLTVLSALQAALPQQAFVYLADHANAPYGTRPASEILDLTLAACQRLFDLDCRLIVLACNTASSVALRPMQEYFVPADRRVLGVLVPMIEVLAGRAWALRSAPTPAPVARAMLFATPATVASGAFSREVGLRATGIEVTEVACPGLVDALEAGDSATAAAIVAERVSYGLAKMPAPQVAVLGCTHYPLVQPAFAAHLPAETQILSQGAAVAEALCDYLRRAPRFAGSGRQTYLTTGAPDQVAAAARALKGRQLAFAPA